MRKLFTFLFVLTAIIIHAQTPNQFNYQAVARNSNGELLSEQNIKVQISIIPGALDGTSIYTETHTTQTNSYGVFTIKIGTGTTSDNFGDINWSSNSFFIEVQMDPNGGDSFKLIGSSQLLSVPYALHSKTAESITGTINETDPIFEASDAKNITSNDITNWNSKLDSETDGSITNEIQAISISNDTIFLSDGGFVKLPSTTTGEEEDPIFNASTAKSISETDVENWNNKLDSETDGSITNEIQAISISNDSIFLSDGGFVKLPSTTTGEEEDPIFNASTAKSISETDVTNWNNKLDSETDGSITNEIQAISISNDTIFLSDGGNVKLPVVTEEDPLFSASIAKNITATDTAKWNNKLELEIDGSITNELQIISISNDTIFLSQGGYVKLPSANLLRVTKETTDIKCNGESNGKIILSIEGGTSPYYIEWNGTEGTETLSGASAGSYEIYVEDQEGLSLIKRARITEPTAITVTDDITHEDAGNDGEIDITVSGGTPFTGDIYNYEWSDGVTTQDRTGLTEGTYDVTITDQNGCTIEKSLDVESSITEPVVSDIIITEIMYNPNLVDDSDGEWIEIYNTSSEEITANGMQLIDGAGGTVSFDLKIPAGAHQVISKSDETINTGVTPDYILNIPTLNNSGDDVILKYNGVIIDEVTYTDKSAAGYTIELDPASYNATDNDDMTNWNQATNEYTAGAHGTPGVINTTL